MQTGQFKQGTLELPRVLSRHKRSANEFAKASIFVEALTTGAQIMALRNDWLELENEANAKGSTCVFQSFGFVSSFLKYQAERGATSDAFVVIARSGGKVIAILPLGFRREKGLRILTGLAEPFQQYTELLIADRVDRDEVFLTMLRWIAKAPADLLHLGQVRSDSALAELAEKHLQKTGEDEIATSVDLRAFENFGAFYRNISAKNRKIMRNANNRLTKIGERLVQVEEKGDALSAIMLGTFDGRQALLRDKGMTSRAFSTHEMRQFIKTLAHDAEAKSGLLAIDIFAGRVRVSRIWGLCHADTFYAYMSHWNTSLAPLSPGKLQLGIVIDEAMKRGFTRVDFMIPAMPYKEIWANARVGVCDYALPLTPSGYLYNNFWLSFFRPLAKRAFNKISPQHRQKLLAMLGSQA